MLTEVGYATCQVRDDYGWKNNLIKVAGTTLLKSEEVLKQNSDELVEDFSKNHHKLLEFIWYPFRIKILKKDDKKLEKLLVEWFDRQKGLRATIDNIGLIVSGNGRAWKEYFIKNYDFEYSKPILQKLKQINRPIFNDFLDGDTHPHIRVIEMREKSIRNLDWEHRKIHDWVFVKFFDISLSAAYDIDNDGRNSKVNLSTKDVSLKDFNFTFDIKEENGKDIDEMMLLDSWLNNTQTLYAYLLNKNYPVSKIQNILPLGTNIEMVQASRLEDWEYYFKVQEAKATKEGLYLSNRVKEEFIGRKFILKKEGLDGAQV
jgi:hypothetical protein